MKTYWDYEEKERSELTAETVTSLLDVELMTAGILKPKTPEYKPVPDAPVGEKAMYYGVQGKSKYGSDEHIGVCFKTAEDAQKFIDLNPSVRDYDYEVGSEYAFATPLSKASVISEKLYDAAAINDYRSQLKNRKAASDFNAKLKSDFAAACTKAENATKGVWDDWYKCTSERDELSRIFITYQQYLKLASDDHNTAIAFLEKAYPVERIEKAAQWFPDKIVAHRQPELVAAE